MALFGLIQGKVVYLLQLKVSIGKLMVLMELQVLVLKYQLIHQLLEALGLTHIMRSYTSM